MKLRRLTQRPGVSLLFKDSGHGCVLELFVVAHLLPLHLFDAGAVAAKLFSCRADPLTQAPVPTAAPLLIDPGRDTNAAIAARKKSLGDSSNTQVCALQLPLNL